MAASVEVLSFMGRHTQRRSSAAAGRMVTLTSRGTTIRRARRGPSSMLKISREYRVGFAILVHKPLKLEELITRMSTPAQPSHQRAARGEDVAVRGVEGEERTRGLALALRRCELQPPLGFSSSLIIVHVR